MATVDALQIKNLRSLVDTGWIEQKPITILVGKNSAGKSTFARVFPLIKQSVGERKQSPILWFGQYVDFGQFSVAVHNKTPDAEVSFGFKLTVSPLEIERNNRDPRFGLEEFKSVARKPFTVEVETFLVKGSDLVSSDTEAKKLIIKILGFSVNINFKNKSVIESLVIDDLEVWREKDGIFFSHITFNSAIPKMNFYREKKASNEIESAIKGQTYLEDYSPFGLPLIKEIKRRVHGNILDDKVEKIASRLIFSDDHHFYDNALSAGANYQSWLDSMRTSSNDPKSLRTLQRCVLCAKLPELLQLIDSTLSAHFSAVQYIEPLRATAQRYYRKQDLAIGEIDSKGSNVAQFLQGLPTLQKQEFDEVTRRLFGFSVKAQAQGGHIELVLEQIKGGTLVNLADAGVGFSQILPILLQFWASDAGKYNYKSGLTARASTTLVVEQPELHLHPAYQATLADLFCETAAPKKRRRTRVIAETHSPALINRLGSLVAEGNFQAEDIQVLLFEQDGVEGKTRIRVAKFDDEGVLSNWPFGFFEPEI